MNNANAIKIKVSVSGVTTMAVTLAHPEAPVGPNADWSVITYVVSGAEGPEHARRLVETSIILHTHAQPEANRYELNAAELGGGRVVHAGA